MAAYKKGMTLDAALLDRMKRDDLTQEEAAALLGIAQPRLSKWIKRRNFPSDDALPKLAEFLGITLDDATVLVSRTRTATRSDSERLSQLEGRVEMLESKVDDLLRRLATRRSGRTSARGA